MKYGNSKEYKHKLNQYLLKYLMDSTNRSKLQTEYLFELVGGDTVKLFSLERIIKNNHIFYCPDLKEIDNILSLKEEGYFNYPTITIHHLTDKSTNMEDVYLEYITSNKTKTINLMEGNTWDFHNGCHGMYDLDEFNNSYKLVKIIKELFESNNINVELRNGRYNYKY